MNKLQVNLIGFAMILSLGAFPAGSSASAQRQDLRRLAEETEQHLDRHVLSLWYPRSVDSTRGGFLEGYDEAWRPTGNGSQRSIVYQSRLTWTAAEIVRRFPAKAAEFRPHVSHGVRALRDVMWDSEMGGFHWQVNATTRKPTSETGEKHAYGNSFGIYAAANAYLATGDAAALSLAKDGFQWLDKHAHDDKNGGYFEALARDGKPILTPPAVGRRDFIGTRFGFKSMNSHIHLLEAFTELHKAWRNPKVKSRLRELFLIVRDKVYVDPGALHLFFNPDWRPVPDHDSFGHDVETAYLLVEAAEELGLHDDEKTWRAAKNLVDHALEVGWDVKNGGFYDNGNTFGPATGLDKVWWTQAEGLNALLLMHEKFGADDPTYLTAFQKQWAFITAHQVDARHGGWLSSVEADGRPRAGQPKSDMWKDPYHQGRALINVISRLRKLAQ